MASNPRPSTRTNITYGPLGGTEATANLMPVFIAPRYALHKHEEGYEDAFLCEYDALTNGTAVPCSWPSVTDNPANVDIQSAKLVAENLVVAVNTTAITGVTVDTEVKNKLIFPKAVCGENRSDLLNGYDVRIGDYIYTDGMTTPLVITDIQPALVDAVGTVTTQAGATAPTIAWDKFTGTASTVYTLSIISSTSSGVKVLVTSLFNDSYTEQVSCAFGVPTEIGNKGVTVTYSEGSYEIGEAVKVVVTPAGEGDMKIVFVNTSDVTLTDNLYIATANLADAVVELGDAAWVAGTDGTITLNDVINVRVANETRRIYKADMYVEFRELLTDDALTLVSSNAQGAAAFAGIRDPQNPMGMMYHNAKEIDGAAFYMMSVSADTDSAFVEAVNVAAKYETAYAPVTYRQTKTVTDAVLAVISKYSNPLIAQFKSTWFVAQTTKEFVVYPKEGAALGTVRDGIVSFEDDVALISAGVRAGDILCVIDAYDANKQTYSNYEYKVIAVDSETTMRVEAGKNINSWTKMVIKRVRSNMDYAMALAKEARDINNHNVKLVWCDSATMGGFAGVDCIYVAAQLAAMRSAMPPHAPLSDVAVVGVSIADTMKLSDAEYEAMNNGGVWVVANNQDGDAITYHQITTLTDGTMAEEESAVSNSHAMVREFRLGMKKYKGNANIYKGLLPQMRADLNKIADNIIARQYKAIYGPQLLSFTVKDLYIPESNNAKVVVRCAMETPKPLLAADYEFNIF